jgi:hypothetical protein
MAAERPDRRPPAGLVLRETEAGFQLWVTDLAQLKGWSWVHFRPARTEHGWRTPVEGDAAGWVDLMLCRPPRLIFAELKSERGRLSADQEAWQHKLRACHAEVYIWRPADRPAIKVLLQ